MLLNPNLFYLYLFGSCSYGFLRKKNQLYNELLLTNNQKYNLLIYSLLVGPFRFPINIIYDAGLLRYNHSNKYIKYMNN